MSVTLLDREQRFFHPLHLLDALVADTMPVTTDLCIGSRDSACRNVECLH
jgi:hypothetical protein